MHGSPFRTDHLALRAEARLAPETQDRPKDSEDLKAVDQRLADWFRRQAYSRIRTPSTGSAAAPLTAAIARETWNHIETVHHDDFDPTYPPAGWPWTRV